MQARVATLDDCDTIAELIAAFRQHLNASVPSDSQIGEGLPALLIDSRFEFCIAEAPSHSGVGYVQTRFVPTAWGGLEAFVDDLFVRPELRRGGVGRALLDCALERARSRGARTAALCTNEHNERALDLYASAGFELRADPIWSGGREVRLERALR